MSASDSRTRDFLTNIPSHSNRGLWLKLPHLIDRKQATSMTVMPGPENCIRSPCSPNQRRHTLLSLCERPSNGG